DLLLDDFIHRFSTRGISSVICTDVSRDGKMIGPAFDLYESIKNKWPVINVIASGGVASLADIYALNEMNIDGVIIGKALYEGNIHLNHLKEFLC
ncbi:MAG: 1-(5-phosphoribosyl)-5-[(5-phosphoribosylamino)methylideneamino]imidazole-4-carboxamide isomerase, partial [Caldithrix sp.]|nr:1-(5-phosphoribosyl)-5-[(5-phosphoribosylamino)methylideneamino]imidazole-4-carboxamide isomerase [Caldithrix sp.]